MRRSRHPEQPSRRVRPGSCRARAGRGRRSRRPAEARLELARCAIPLVGEPCRTRARTAAAGRRAPPHRGERRRPRRREPLTPVAHRKRTRMPEHHVAVRDARGRQAEAATLKARWSTSTWSGRTSATARCVARADSTGCHIRSVRRSAAWYRSVATAPSRVARKNPRSESPVRGWSSAAITPGFDPRPRRRSCRSNREVLDDGRAALATTTRSPRSRHAGRQRGERQAEVRGVVRADDEQRHRRRPRARAARPRCARPRGRPAEGRRHPLDGEVVPHHRPRALGARPIGFAGRRGEGGVDRRAEPVGVPGRGEEARHAPPT